MNKTMISVLAAVSLVLPVNAMAAGIANQQQAKDAAIAYMLKDTSGAFVKSRAGNAKFIQHVRADNASWYVLVLGHTPSGNTNGELVFSAKTGKLVDRLLAGED